MKAQPCRSEQDANCQSGRTAVNGDERPRELEVDVEGPCHLQSVLDLVSMLDELAEAPSSDVELFPGQLLARVQRLEGGGAFAAGEVFGGNHSSLFGCRLRRLEIRGLSLWLVHTGLRNQRVLVTGASGGIGSACARAFFAEGCRVAVHYHEGLERAEALSDELRGAPIFRADLRVEDDVAALFQDAVAELGGLDVCAAVAGRWPEEDVPLWNLPLERWEATLRENLT
jgi:short chain dehydrogenase